MKKGFKIILIIAVICVFLGAVLAVVPALTKKLDFHSYASTVSGKLKENFNIRIDGSFDTYSSGGSGEAVTLKSDGIKNLKVDWGSGSVDLAAGSSDIEFYETTVGIAEPLSYHVSGDTLFINFANDDVINVFSGGEKNLHVTVPEELLASVEFTTVSASVTVNGMDIAEISSETVSGGLKLTDVSCREVNAESTSGKISFSGTAREISCETVSGSIDLTLGSCPKELDISTTSGNTDVTLPEDSSFTLEADTVSGDIESDFDILFSPKTEKYIYGDGKADFSFESVSGCLFLNKASSSI